MNLTNLLVGKNIDPRRVLVLRHRPHEPELRKVLPWLAAERHDLFNAYQQTQGERVERTMQKLEGSGYVASFIGQEAGKALFIGLYSLGGTRRLTRAAFWRVPALKKLKAFGLRGFTKEWRRTSCLWFDLRLTDFYAHWKGRLVVGWPPPERSWWRRAHRNDFPILAIYEDSALDATMLEWDKIDFTWEQLSVLPTRWRTKLMEWRGIYYIFDTSDGKGYVGSAYGKDNVLGRWMNYKVSGHGGNRLLRKREPRNFRFTILQRVSPDMDAADVIRLEASWKERLHTRAPHGLNDN